MPTLSFDQQHQVKCLYGVIDKKRVGRVDYASLIITFGGDMGSVLTDMLMPMDNTISFKLWRDHLESLQSEKGNSFLTAILQLMERRHKESLDGAAKRKHSALLTLTLSP